MALYTLDINENTKQGKALAQLLKTQDSAELRALKDIEDLEEKYLLYKMKKNQKKDFLSEKETDEFLTELNTL